MKKIKKIKNIKEMQNKFKKNKLRNLMKVFVFIISIILIVVILVALGNKRMNSVQQKQASILQDLKRDLKELKYNLMGLSRHKNNNNNVFYLSEEPVPASTAVSKVFYQSLSNTTQPDVESKLTGIPKTHNQWDNIIADRDELAAIKAKAISKKFKTSIMKDNIANVDVYWVTPSVIDPKLRGKVLVYIHGGAFMFNGGLASTIEASIIANYAKMPVLAIDYSKGPDSPAPAAMDDITAVWKKLLKTRRAKSMVMGGTSAGATLTMVAIQNFNRLKLPTPAALYLGTPAIEVNQIGDSKYINEGMDRNLVSWRGMVQEMANLYTGDNSPKSPIVSPAYGSFKNFPPTYLITGTRDILLSDTIRAHRAIKRAGGEAVLNVYEGQSHGDYIAVLNSPESKEHYTELAKFFRKYLLR